MPKYKVYFEGDRVGMKNLLLIEDTRPNYNSIEERIDSITREYHPSKYGRPYSVYDFNTDKLLFTKG